MAQAETGEVYPAQEEQWVGPMARGWNKPFEKRTGLVLSGGGLKFAVHAGIYSRLETIPYYEGGEALPRLEASSGQVTLPPLIEAFDCVVGTSAGSILAAAIACGFCAEDVERFSLLFSNSDFQPLVLDPNWLGAGSFLLRGDPGYLKGLYRGEAIQRTLQVFFSHNFLSGLGGLYRSYGEKKLKPEGPQFTREIGNLIRQLHRLPVERLPQMSAETERTTSGKNLVASGEELSLITFQDINPGFRIPFIRFMRQNKKPQEARAYAETHFAAFRDHTGRYQSALHDYYAGRAAAGLPPLNPAAPRPMLLITGTDLVTGQKTIFSNYNQFEKELVYSKVEANRTQPPVSYRYISPEGRLSPLPTSLTEKLRPVNYLYKYLSSGLPVSWAVRSSLSIPGVFAPAVIHYRDDQEVERTDFFIDGGVTDNYALQVAVDWSIARCGRVLGGDIGNLGPRVHNFSVRSVIEILLRTLMIQGDVNVDANAANGLVQSARVTTIDELTRNEVGSIRELSLIPGLLKEGEGLADQFFTFFRDQGQGPLRLDRLFSQENRYLIFLPRIENYSPPGEDPAPVQGAGQVTFEELPTGSSEIDRIVETDRLSPSERQKIRAERSRWLGVKEDQVTPPPVVGPGRSLWGPTGGVKMRPGQLSAFTPKTLDPLNLGRLAFLLLLLSFFSFFGLGLWRVAGSIWDFMGWAWVRTALNQFQSWNFWQIFLAVITGIGWANLVFFRALVFDFWVTSRAKFSRRLLAVPVSLGFHLIPLFIINLLGGFSGGFWGELQNLAGLVLIPLSAGALLYLLYALIASGRIASRQFIRR